MHCYKNDKIHIIGYESNGDSLVDRFFFQSEDRVFIFKYKTVVTSSYLYTSNSNCYTVKTASLH